LGAGLIVPLRFIFQYTSLIMVQVAVLAALLCSAAALHLKEDTQPIREVSPEDFHRQMLKQALVESEGPKKGKKNQPQEEVKDWAQIKEDKKQQAIREKRQAKFKAQREQEMALVSEAANKNKHEEEDLIKEANERVAEAKKTAAEDANKVHMPWEAKVEAPKPPTVSLIKTNKTFACADGNKEVLTLYVSQIAGGASTRTNINREKCMRSQLDQHCMPYESFPATIVEPCDDNDWACANKRVLNDHANCLTKSVDWDSVRNYAKDSGKTMWEVLGSWCSHVNLLKEVSRRILQDEKFVADYPALLMLEDHVILDKEWTEEVAKDWVHNYPGQWDMVQLDTYGGGKGLNRDKVGEFRNKRVWRPSWKGQYAGFHAVLVNTKSVPTLLEKMQSLNVVPVEWLTKSMNDASAGLEVLSWEAGISTVSWEGSKALKQTWMPNVPACTEARKFKSQY